MPLREKQPVVILIPFAKVEEAYVAETVSVPDKVLVAAESALVELIERSSGTISSVRPASVPPSVAFVRVSLSSCVILFVSPMV